MVRRWLLVFLSMILTVGGMASIHAQDTIVLTVAIPQWVQDGFNKAYFDAFREANPGVDVVIVPDTEGLAYTSSPAYATLEEHLEKSAEYVSMADVLYTTSYTITPENTQAGLWLDLQPLISVDPDLDEANFYPPAWRAFRWDGGMWSLPTLLMPQILAYNPKAFDEAGLTYPDANWSMENFSQAAIKLTKYDDKGNAIQPGCFCNPTLMMYGALGHGLVDSMGAPDLTDPKLAEIVESWAEAQKQIYPEGGYSSEGVSLLVMEPWALSPDNRDPNKLVAGSLPGGVYGTSTYGFGISRASLNPELAFKLIKYMTEKPINSYGGFGSFPALRNAQTETPSGYSIPSIDDIPPESQQILRDAVETGLSGADLLYFDYVNQAMTIMSEKQIDAATALQEVQQIAMDNRTQAAAWANSQTLAVATAVPTPSFGANEYALNFGTSYWSIPNQESWDRLAREFAEADPEVGGVNINRQANDYEAWQQENECYLLTYDVIGPDSQPDYLALDPLLNADPDFNPNDLVPGALEALQVEGQTYAYPLALSLSTLIYNPEQFEKANVPLPQLNWTVNEFIDALNQLAQSDQDEFNIPFAPRTYENTDWLLLMAAYGAVPMDSRTDPPTYNFSDPTTVDTIRQVLDLAKNGLIDYQKLGTFSYSGVPKTGALTATMLTGDNNYQVTEQTAYVNFPQGSNFGVVSLGSVQGGYIRSDATHVDACYRWISFIAQHPELFAQVMPARLSALDNPATLASQGESAIALYRNYATLATDPNTVNIPANFGGSFESYFVHQFLNRAFDAYVLDDADLEQSLTDAQTKAEQFIECSKSIAEVDENSTQEEFEAYNNSTEDCIALVDPEMAAERQEAMGDVQ